MVRGALYPSPKLWAPPGAPLTQLLPRRLEVPPGSCKGAGALLALWRPLAAVSSNSNSQSFLRLPQQPLGALILGTCQLDFGPPLPLSTVKSPTDGVFLKVSQDIHPNLPHPTTLKHSAALLPH